MCDIICVILRRVTPLEWLARLWALIFQIDQTPQWFDAMAISEKPISFSSNWIEYLRFMHLIFYLVC